jgi:hypothetical protein
MRPLPNRRTGPAVRLVVLALCVAGAALAGAAVLAAPADSAAQSAVRQAPTADQERGTFRHGQHESVTCGVCHAREERHRSRRTWTARDCAACHHGTATPAGCTSCHERADFAPPRPTTTPMALSVWESPRVRELTFDHDRHTEVGCLDCHQSGMNVPPESCASCHTHHHRPEAECAQCHVAPDPAVHDLASHAACGACHSAEATARPMLSRPSCLVCHEAQRQHRPGRSCAQCHIMPRTTARE